MDEYSMREAGEADSKVEDGGENRIGKSTSKRWHMARLKSAAMGASKRLCRWDTRDGSQGI